MKPKKISPNVVVPSEHARRHMFVHLPASTTLEMAVKGADTDDEGNRVELWEAVQHGANRLRLFDSADFLSSDSLMLWVSCFVIEVIPRGGLRWSHPLKMIEVERPAAVFEDERHGLRVVPRGTGFCVSRRNRDGGWTDGELIYGTEQAAKHAAIISLPKQVA